MARMIVFCAACSAQNFVSVERRAALHSPPRCWKCAETLPLPGETAPDRAESKGDAGNVKTTGSGMDA